MAFYKSDTFFFMGGRSPHTPLINDKPAGGGFQLIDFTITSPVPLTQRAEVRGWSRVCGI